jgi:peptidoglycan hydrolase-like protein with peptidoglycan-binding domain
MYPRNASRLLTPAGLARFQDAYDEKRKAIGWWDRNTEAVGLIQCYLHVLGYKMTKSVKVDAKRALVPDGAFGQETFEAVWKFQADNHIKVDGMVGQETFDALARKLDPPRPAAHGSYDAVIIHEVRRPCRPGELICPDPDTQ